jgi:undecaprenyl pyrophosphate synthase
MCICSWSTLTSTFWRLQESKLNGACSPKGYGEGQDPQQYDRRLRPRVDDNRELAVDPNTGMKAYIASHGQGFDTSYDCVKRTLQKCIEYGRRDEMNDAYRELGRALHTLEGNCRLNSEAMLTQKQICRPTRTSSSCAC